MTTLKLITSCSQRSLMEALADNISSAPLPALEKERIIVLSNGMSRWISMELAAAHGVSAGLDFCFPNDLLDVSFSTILSGSFSSLPFTVTSLSWRIAQQLPNFRGQSGFEQISAYLGDDADDRRLLQISRSLADCFDQYTIFRPDMVSAWDRGESSDWQAQLWRSISRTCGGTHRASLLKSLQSHAAAGAPARGALPERISLFGISYLPPFHLEALKLLSNYCPVTCYLLNPCGQYWGTIISRKMKSRLPLEPGPPAEANEYYETGNPLLSSFGTLGQEFFETLLDYGFEAEELGSGAETTSRTGESGTPSILSVIQNDILTLYDGTTDGPPRQVSADDRSLQIHSCHGPLREMEILYDNLLSLFDELPDLEPRQIVVMTPDIEAYAPYINSVFGSRSPGRPPLPYSIADRSVRGESHYAEAFLKVIDGASSRFSLRETLDLLEISPIMNRFDISEDELTAIGNWLTDCHVRWGSDAAHRAELGFPDYDDFSWQSGLDRLMLGHAMSPDNSSTYDGILPYPACSGSQAETLGKLVRFIETLRKYSLLLKGPHPSSEWADVLADMTAQMLLADEKEPEGLLSVARALQTLREAATLHGFTGLLSGSAVRDHLSGILTGKSGGYGFMGGGITFCAMLPMRSIPMRVIWLAGMNDGQFPRTEKPPGFSLMNGVRRRGDRSLRDEDRYLFLEALMAAEDRFCISYNGQSDRDNSLLGPSVLVSELIDYTANSFVHSNGTTPASVVITHRLQGFSPAYFNNSDPVHLFSYDRETALSVEAGRVSVHAPRVFLESPLPLEGTPDLQVDLTQLRRFLANPAAFFLEQRLRISLFNPAEEPSDSEPFSLDPLSRYNLAQELIGQLLKGVPYQECLAAARSRGVLPPLTAGRAAFDTVWESSRRFAEELEPHRGSQLGALPVSFRHGSIHLNALLDNCQSGIHLRWRCAAMKGKDRLSIWLDHLLLNIAKKDGYPLQSRLIASDSILELPPVDHAAEILSGLLEVFAEGMTRPLRFFPETSWHFLSEGQQKAGTAWNGDRRRGFPGEGDAPAVTLCFGGEEPWGEEFSLLAERIYGPLITATAA